MYLQVNETQQGLASVSAGPALSGRPC